MWSYGGNSDWSTGGIVPCHGRPLHSSLRYDSSQRRQSKMTFVEDVPKTFRFLMSSIKISDFRFAEEKVKVALVKTSAL